MLKIERLPTRKLRTGSNGLGLQCMLFEEYVPDCEVSLWYGSRKGKSLITLYFYREGYVFLIDGSLVKRFHCQNLFDHQGLSEEQLKTIAALLAEGRRINEIVKILEKGG